MTEILQRWADTQALAQKKIEEIKERYPVPKEDDLPKYTPKDGDPKSTLESKKNKLQSEVVQCRQACTELDDFIENYPRYVDKDQILREQRIYRSKLDERENLKKKCNGFLLRRRFEEIKEEAAKQQPALRQDDLEDLQHKIDFVQRRLDELESLDPATADYAREDQFDLQNLKNFYRKKMEGQKLSLLAAKDELQENQDKILEYCNNWREKIVEAGSYWRRRSSCRIFSIEDMPMSEKYPVILQTWSKRGCVILAGLWHDQDALKWAKRKVLDWNDLQTPEKGKTYTHEAEYGQYRIYGCICCGEEENFHRSFTEIRAVLFPKDVRHVSREWLSRALLALPLSQDSGADQLLLEWPQGDVFSEGSPPKSEAIHAVDASIARADVAGPRRRVKSSVLVVCGMALAVIIGLLSYLSPKSQPVPQSTPANCETADKIKGVQPEQNQATPDAPSEKQEQSKYKLTITWNPQEAVTRVEIDDSEQDIENLNKGTGLLPGNHNLKFDIDRHYVPQPTKPIKDTSENLTWKDREDSLIVTIDLTSDRAIDFTFKPNSCPVTFKIEPERTGTGKIRVNNDTPKKEYQYHEEISLQAIGNEWFKFEKWNISGGAEPKGEKSQNEIKVRIEPDMTITAKFKETEKYKKIKNDIISLSREFDLSMKEWNPDKVWDNQQVKQIQDELGSLKNAMETLAELLRQDYNTNPGEFRKNSKNKNSEYLKKLKISCQGTLKREDWENLKKIDAFISKATDQQKLKSQEDTSKIRISFEAFADITKQDLPLIVNFNADKITLRTEWENKVESIEIQDVKLTLIENKWTTDAIDKLIAELQSLERNEK